jgi:hypothetical protein
MVDKDIWQIIWDKAVAYGREMERKEKENSLPPSKVTSSKNLRAVSLNSKFDSCSQKST